MTVKTMTRGPQDIAGLLAQLRARVGGFRREEDGAMIIFGLYILVAMMIVSGIAFDLMRFETERMRTQSAIDRSVLAAASLSQPLTAQEVVESYFEKSGVTGNVNISEERGINFRTVSASSRVEVPTRFLRMVDRTMLLGQLSPKLAVHDGVFTLGAASGATAIENIPNVEISLVLDNSGSMNSNNRLTNLKTAAREFIHAMQCNPSDPNPAAECTVEEGRVTISIVPYNEQATVGEDLLRHLNVTNEHSYSHCVDFQTSDYFTTAIGPDTPLQRTGHFDPWTARNGLNPANNGLTVPDHVICKTHPGGVFTVFEDNPVQATQRMNMLNVGGDTSIEIGMKWGSALLDPAMRPVIDAMIDEGVVQEIVRGRPTDYSDNETIKVVVVMSDGQNTGNHELLPQYRSGLSEFWRNDEDGRYSIYRASTNRYYWPHIQAWRDWPWGNGSGEPGNAIQQTYPEVWAAVRTRYYYQTYSWLDRPDFRNLGAIKDSRLNSICNATKSNGVVIFAIGFEAPNAGREALRNCASSFNHYFDASGLEISDVFASIAAAINNLKLIQ